MPSPITDLVVDNTGLYSAGQMGLVWTATTSNTALVRVSTYVVRYRAYDGVNGLSTEGDWAMALMVPPGDTVPSLPGVVERLVVSNLIPGSRYIFAIKSIDEYDSQSSLSNAADGVATANCTEGAADGEGTATFLPAASFPSGTVVKTTMTFTVGVSSIQPGGKVAFRIPESMPWPYINGNGEWSGVVSTAAVTSTAQLQFDTTGPMVIASVLSGQLVPGDKIKIYYFAQTCDLARPFSFRVYSQAQACGQLKEIAQSPFTRIAVPGTATQFTFKTWNPLALVGAVTPMKLVARDQCWNQVPLAAALPFTLSAVKSMYPTVLDDIPLISTAADFSSPFVTANLSVPSGASEFVFYYKLNAGDLTPTKQINLNYTWPGNSWAYDTTVSIANVQSGITNASVDTGDAQTHTTVTFSPDNDGTNDWVFINFVGPENMSWRVDVSSDDFNSVLRRFWGYGPNGRLSWDGMRDGQAGSGPQVAPPGLYRFRISYGDDSLLDTTLSATLQSNSLRGAVKDDTGLALENVDVNMFGPSFRFVRTQANGTFFVGGLRSGSYQFRLSKAGYESKEESVTIGSGETVLSTRTLAGLAMLILTATRPVAAAMPEVWGNFNADSADGQRHAWANFHFRQGAITADAGDSFNAVPTTYTILSLAPNVTYHVRLNMPYYSTNNFDVTLSSKEVRAQQVTLVQRGNIFGTVSLPAGGNSNGVWISMEAGPDANNDGNFDSSNPSERFWGGGWFNPGVSSGTVSIFGVADGAYLLKANAPGFVRSSTQAVVSNGSDANVVFPVLSQGGVVYGSIRIEGDTNDIDTDQNGFIDVSVNAWSRTTWNGGWTQVSIPVNATLSQSTFTLNGLEDGNYESYEWLQGFENVPPGPKSVRVENSSGTLALVFKQFSGSIAGAITLPPGATDYGNVSIQMQSFDYGQAQSPSASIDSVNGTYSITNLGSGYSRFTAVYQTTGYIFEKSVQMVNGQALTMNIDLRGTTYAIRGAVQTNTRSPFDSLSYLVNQTTPTLLTPQGASSFPKSAARVRVDRIRRYSNDDPNMMGANASMFDPAKTTFALYDVVSGTFAVPNLPPGTYEITTNGELDNDITNGLEIAELKESVNIVNADVWVDTFTLIDGYKVSGSLRVDSGTPETGRTVRVNLKNAQEKVIQKAFVNVMGVSADFTLNRVPPGSYGLSVEDTMEPRKYSAKEVPVKIEAEDKENVELTLLQAARIKGKLRLKKSGDLLSDRNYSQILPDNFYIEARSNPWFPGGWGRVNDGEKINSEGYFEMAVNPGTYDIILRAEGALTDEAIASGKKSFAPKKVSAVVVAAGEVKDLGVIDLVEGDTISGTVTDADGVPLVNIPVKVVPSSSKQKWDDALEGTTNKNGIFNIAGIDTEGLRYYDITIAPRPDRNDDRFRLGFSGTSYGEIRRLQYDTQKTETLLFKLHVADAMIAGKVQTSDGGKLIQPFESAEYPGANLILNKHGNIPQNNPLGDIEESTNDDGTFAVKGLAPGVYDMYVLVRNYRGYMKKNIVVDASATTDVGTLVVSTGPKLYGTLSKEDGSAPSSEEIDGVIAIRDGFEELIVGNITSDASKNSNSYSISGFDPTKAYSIIGFPKEDDSLFVLKENLVVDQDTELNLIIKNQAPSIITHAQKSTTTAAITIQFDFTKPLRNSSADDSDATKIVSVTNGAGALTIPDEWLSSDRSRARVVYTPAAGEKSFELTVSATFTSVNSLTGLPFSRNQAFTYYAGIGRQKTSRITNAGGGEVGLEDDPSKFIAQAGTFGDDSSLNVDVVFREALDDISQLTTAEELDLGRSRVMQAASVLGGKAYPVEMAGAIRKAAALEVDPLSSYYDVFLPVGVSHFFPKGKEAQICLRYNEETDGQPTDPSALNIYYFNPETNEFLLEQLNRVVDTENLRLCATISHASVFTIYASSVPIISTSVFSGELAVINFPNPFNLQAKTVTLQDSNNETRSITGTMLKISAPASAAGTATIDIYDVSGEKIRTIAVTIEGGKYNYFEWDGTNDSGSAVASGVYVARLSLAGQEKFFKMAVLK